MERDFETGKHEEEVRNCAYSECGKAYAVQLGGQKSGSSPAVHVGKVGESPQGFCSTRCVYLANGWDLTPLKEYYSSLGLSYDRIFPPGYLAPASRLNGKWGEE
jgi:hypothetical protein